MMLLYLKERVTHNQTEYLSNISSAESKIFVDVEQPSIDDAGFTIDLHVGSAYFSGRDNVLYGLPLDGLLLRPGRAVVIQVKETLGVPHNAFGIVTGKGKLIFEGLFVSPGKVDPGYSDKLLIGVFNGSQDMVRLRSGSPLCGCSFVLTETTPPTLAQHRSVTNVPRIAQESIKHRVTNWWRRDWKMAVAWFIAIVSAVGSMGKFLLDLIRN